MDLFEVSKLECMAIRRQDWLFSIMPLSYADSERIGLYQRATQVCEDYNKGFFKKMSVDWGCSKYKLVGDVINELMFSEEFYSQVKKIKSLIWQEMVNKYSLIEEYERGMYERHTIIIQDNITKKFYQGACDNYGGSNWPNITFSQVIPTTEPKIRYEISNQSKSNQG